MHREDIAHASEERQALMAKQTAMLVDLANQNTQLTETIKALTERVEALTTELHRRLIDAAT
jgi:hypothetical protein